MHVDRLASLLHDIVQSNLNVFFSDFLPLLVSGMPLSKLSKDEVLKSWPHEIYSFTSNCFDFLSECRFAMNKENQIQE